MSSARRFVARCSDLLVGAFQHCEKLASQPSRAELQSFLTVHALPALAQYSQAQQHSAAQIFADEHFTGRLREALQASRETDPAALYSELRELIARDPSLRWALDSAAPPQMDASRLALHWLRWLIRMTPTLIALLCHVRSLMRATQLENAAPRVTMRPLSVPAQDDASATQNAYNSVASIKREPGRRLSLRLFLSFLETMGQTRADLSGIATLHFLHWAELDRGRRLLFCSMYDGAWEAYMADFIELAGWGLSGVWSHTRGFPRTDWLLLNGARDEQAFRNFVRSRQVETSFWYRAYPGLSSCNIADARRVRAELRHASTRSTQEQWLTRL